MISGWRAGNSFYMHRTVNVDCLTAGPARMLARSQQSAETRQTIKDHQPCEAVRAPSSSAAQRLRSDSGCTRTAAKCFSFDAPDFSEAGFAAAARFRRRSVILVVRHCGSFHETHDFIDHIESPARRLQPPRSIAVTCERCGDYQHSERPD